MTVCLTLFISGDFPESSRIAAAVRHWCERYLPGCYRLDVHDIRDGASPEALPVLATPALALESPPMAVPLSDLVKVSRGIKDKSIYRKNQQRVVYVMKWQRCI